MRDSEDSSSLRNPLWDAYRTRTCESHAGPQKIVIRIGEPNPLLDALLREHARSSWCCITAWNPAGDRETWGLGVENGRYEELPAAASQLERGEGEKSNGHTARAAR